MKTHKFRTSDESYLGCLRTPYGTTRMWDMNAQLGIRWFRVFVTFTTNRVVFAYATNLPKNYAIDSRQAFLDATVWTTVIDIDSTSDQVDWIRSYGESLTSWIEEQKLVSKERNNE